MIGSFFMWSRRARVGACEVAWSFGQVLMRSDGAWDGAQKVLWWCGSVLLRSGSDRKVLYVVAQGTGRCL